MHTAQSVLKIRIFDEIETEIETEIESEFEKILAYLSQMGSNQEKIAVENLMTHSL